MRCGLKQPISHFYKHPQTKDGYLNQCKSCKRTLATQRRNNNIEVVREKDRQRGNRQSKEYRDDYKRKYPNKYKAHTIVNNALRSNKITKPKECSSCGSTKTIHGHHDDYLKPLDVRWLCSACHSQWHRDNSEALNP